MAAPTGTPARTRAPWGSVSREAIVDAAARLVTEVGFEHLTIRGVAARLGVAPMTLYRHVRDKDDLLEEVVDRELAAAWRPRTRTDDWRVWTSEAADRFRRFLVAQPAAMHLYLKRPVASPAAVARMDAMLDVLRSAGADEAAAQRAYASLHTYTVGFAALESSRNRGDAGATHRNPRARRLAGYTTPRQFALGLEDLLEGIARRMGPAAGR